MNQVLLIATPILAALVTARPAGNIASQAAEALDRAAALLSVAEYRGFDIVDYDAAIALSAVMSGVASPQPQLMPAKRKS